MWSASARSLRPCRTPAACRLASTASTAELAAEVGFIDAAIEVPAGIQAVLERQFARGGPYRQSDFWARVPHYVAAMPYPAASAALLDKLASFANLRIDTSGLREAADTTSTRIDELVASNDEHRSMVEQLEAAFDAEEHGGSSGASLPTGDEIAAELERFLREQRE